VLVGAAAMAIAAFLPLVEPTGLFHMVQDNTLIQYDGWELIALAVGIAAGGFRASQGRRQWWWLSAGMCLIAVAQIAVWFMDKGLRTLYPVGSDGKTDTSLPGIEATLGIALYVAGAGVALALIGSVMLRQTEEPLAAAREAAGTTKKCPDCAETILADARVCKHCGYRFALDAPNALLQKPSEEWSDPPPMPPGYEPRDQ
jgi:hypothetical protein